MDNRKGAAAMGDPVLLSIAVFASNQDDADVLMALCNERWQFVTSEPTKGDRFNAVMFLPRWQSNPDYSGSDGMALLSILQHTVCDDVWPLVLRALDGD